jgi:hypothetical protein
LVSKIQERRINIGAWSRPKEQWNVKWALSRASLLGGGGSYDEIGIMRKCGHFQGHIIILSQEGKQVMKPSHPLPEGKEEDRTR